MAAALRLEVGGVRGSSEYARFVAEELGTIAGVQHVTTNPSTGSVMVLYEPPPNVDRGTGTSVRALAVASEQRPSRGSSAATATLAERVGQVIVAGLVEFALQRALGPLFFRRR